MCFLGGDSSSQPTNTPTPSAPAPAASPAAAPPEEATVGAGRKRENVEEYGSIKGPTTRIDRSVSGGVSGGTGLDL